MFGHRGDSLFGNHTFIHIGGVVSLKVVVVEPFVTIAYKLSQKSKLLYNILYLCNYNSNKKNKDPYET